MFIRAAFIMLVVISGSLSQLSAVAYAGVKIFLQQKVIIENRNPVLGDIALIDSNNSDIEEIKKIQIEKDIYSDGYIDRKEIYSLLKNNTSESIFIYGNAVRIINREQLNKAALNQTGEILVKKGDRVEIVVKKKGISLIMRGIVVTEARADEEVSVRIENRTGAHSKLLTGRIISKDVVEVIL